MSLAFCVEIWTSVFPADAQLIYCLRWPFSFCLKKRCWPNCHAPRRRVCTFRNSGVHLATTVANASGICCTTPGERHSGCWCWSLSFVLDSIQSFPRQVCSPNDVPSITISIVPVKLYFIRCCNIIYDLQTDTYILPNTSVPHTMSMLAWHPENYFSQIFGKLK